MEDRQLPHVGVLEPLVIYGLLMLGTQEELTAVCKRLRPSDFIEPCMSEWFARIKAGTLDLERMGPKERRRLIEEVVKPGAWQYYAGNLRWYVELIREAAIDRGRILSAERRLEEAWAKVKDRTLRFETDRESMRP